MKKDIALIVVVFLLLSFYINSFSEETIHISTEEYAPHTSKKLKHYGVDCHIVTEAFALEGITVKYNFFPGKRSFEMAQEGDVDATLPWVKREDRKKYFYYSDPIIRGGMDGFFHLKSFQFNWNCKQPNYDDLKGIDIGAIIGYNYGPSFQNAEKLGKILVERIPTIEMNFRKLLLGRIELFMSQDDVGYFILQSKFKQKDVQLITHTLEDTKQTEDYHILFSKKKKKAKYFLEAFNRGLKRLKKNSKYNQFIQESQRGDYIKK